MRTARVILRVIEKKSRITWRAFWPYEKGVAFCMRTGHGVCIPTYREGYSEYNDRGEPIPGSFKTVSSPLVWIE